MSSYENYSATSSAYDQTRIPVGIEIITGFFSQSPVALPRQRVLDAGCGTGNYSRALLRCVDRISAVDLNPGMLAKARQKFSGDDADRIEFFQSSIDELPFDGPVFDGIMINQVLHHLDDDAAADYPRVRSLLEELARVLKPGGILSINSCSTRQLTEGFWYCSLIPEAARDMCRRHVSLSELQRLMGETGFETGGRVVPLDAVMQGGAYFDPRGPLDKTWRDGDSIWSTVSEERLAEVRLYLEGLDKAGELETYMREKDRGRSEIGQMTFISARRI